LLLYSLSAYTIIAQYIINIIINDTPSIESAARHGHEREWRPRNENETERTGVGDRRASAHEVLVRRDAERAAFIVLGRPPTRRPPTRTRRVVGARRSAGWSPGPIADRRQHKSRGARAADRRRRRRRVRPHAVLVRRKRERALFAAGKNRTASADGNRLGGRHEALFNGNRKRDRGHRRRARRRVAF